MSLGYELPGTVIEEVTTPASVNPTSTQRMPCFIGTASAYVKVTHEEVTRSSTGLADNLTYTSYGIYEIISCGSQKGLDDFTEDTHFNLTNDQIVFTSSGVVTAGATYFVTYRYVRPSTDYKYKIFYNYNDVVNDLGDDVPTNTLVMIAKLALKVYNIPAISVVQVPATETSNDYSTALDLIKYRDVQTVCALTNSSTVQALVAAHVRERSLAVNGRYRIAYMGAANGTAIGTESNSSSIRGMAVGYQYERVIFVNATRAKYYYNSLTTGEELTATVEGEFIAAAVAAYRDSFSYPATTLLNKTIPGLELYEEDYDDYYADNMLKNAGSSSVFLLKNATGGMKVIDDLTTDNSTVERNNINIITAKDYIAKDVAIQMDRTFKGSLIKNRPNYAGVITDYLRTLFKTYLNNSIIESVDTIRVTLPTTRRDTVQIYYSYYAVYTHKYTEGEFSISL